MSAGSSVGRFLLVQEETGLRSWQAEAVRLLIEEGLSLAGTVLVKTPSGVAGHRRSTRDRGGLLPVECRVDSRASEEKSVEPDFVLSFVPLAMVPDDTCTARLGIWCWQFGRAGAGDPPGPAIADEFVSRDTIRATLMAWLPNDAECRVLYRGNFLKVRHSLPRTRNRVLSSCPEWSRRAWRETVRHPERLLRCDRWQEPAVRGRRKDASRWRILAASLRGALRRLRELYLTEEKWTLGILQRPVTSLLEQPRLDDARWLPELPGTAFLADPCGIPGVSDHVLAEYFDPAAGKGVIARVSLDDPLAPEVMLREDCHLSYPMTFESDGGVYCLPEQSEARRVALYQLDTSRSMLTRPATLLEGIAGVDCTIFRHDGYWWILGCDNDDMDQVKLFGWFSQGLEGPWCSHPLNPLKTDASGARPAGPVFLEAGRLYRPAQDCSQTYGGAVVIHEILALSPERFEERPVARVEPRADGPYPDGVHTISAMGAMVVIDAKRHRISFRKAWNALCCGRATRV